VCNLSVYPRKLHPKPVHAHNDGPRGQAGTSDREPARTGREPHTRAVGAAAALPSEGA
jgi:hypothetical protein